MAGSYRYLRVKDLYQHQFSIEGKRYSVYGKTRQECDEKEDKIRADIANNINPDAEKITLKKYYNMWLQEQRHNVKESTLYSYEKNWVNICPKLGSRKLVELNKQRILIFREELLKEKTITTVNNTIKFLKQLLNSALYDDIIAKNPCMGIKPIKNNNLKATETIHRALTVDETYLFLKRAKDIHSIYFYLFQFMLYSGVRCSEALALTWDDIDYHKKEIIINKTISRYSSKGYKIENSAKTACGKRKIPLTKALKMVLDEQKRMYCELSVVNNENRIFINSRGNTSNYNSVDICIANILRSINDGKIRIQPFSSHAFRDTFATRAIEQGMNPNTLKEILGHSTIKITLDLYAHVMPNTKAFEMSRIRVI